MATKSKSALAPGQIMFDFGAGAVVTTMAAARDWARARNQQSYIDRKAATRAQVEKAVVTAVNLADAAFLTAANGAEVTLEDLAQHDRNLAKIKRDTARATYISLGYGECGDASCTALTTPRASGTPYAYCRDHSFATA